MPDIIPDTTPDRNPAHARRQCRHVFTSGHRCGSPALRQEEFCFYHHTSRRPSRQAELSVFTIPAPEDRSAIQAAIGQVLTRLTAHALDPKRAGLLLYGLQIASLNLPPNKLAADPAKTVEDVIEDPELGLIALPQDLSELRERSCLQDFIDEIEREADERKFQLAQHPQPAPLPPEDPDEVRIPPSCFAPAR